MLLHGVISKDISSKIKKDTHKIFDSKDASKAWGNVLERLYNKLPIKENKMIESDQLLRVMLVDHHMQVYCRRAFQSHRRHFLMKRMKLLLMKLKLKKMRKRFKGQQNYVIVYKIF